MAAPAHDLPVIGRAERIDFPEAGVLQLPAKVDTGAYRSSVWASNVHEREGVLHFTLLGPESPFYSGIALQTTEFKVVEVENSFGQKQHRYSVFLHIRLNGKRVRSNFTLADRASKTYPALIGRKLLKNRFLVNVAAGQPLADEEINGDDSLE